MAVACMLPARLTNALYMLCVMWQAPTLIQAEVAASQTCPMKFRERRTMTGPLARDDLYPGGGGGLDQWGGGQGQQPHHPRPRLPARRHRVSYHTAVILTHSLSCLCQKPDLLLHWTGNTCEGCCQLTCTGQQTTPAPQRKQSLCPTSQVIIGKKLLKKFMEEK